MCRMRDMELPPDMLRCPETLQGLRPLEPAALAGLNAEILSGRAVNREGCQIAEPLQSALLREDGLCAYPVRDSIPVLVAGEAIPIHPSDL